MEQIVFYNSERESIVQCYDFCCEKRMEDYILQFDLQAQISIFNVSGIYKASVVELQKFKEQLDSLYVGNLQKVAFISIDKLLHLRLELERTGRIKQHFSIWKDQTMHNGLTLETYFDQTFLPELSDSIEKTLNSVWFDSESLMNNHSQFYSIRLFNFEDTGYSDYIRFKVELKDSFFHLLTDCEMDMSELLCFKEELTLITQNKIQEISLSPLGEFWSIRFIRQRNEIIVKGDVNDKQFSHNNLVFRWIVSQDWLSELQKQIEKA